MTVVHSRRVGEVMLSVVHSGKVEEVMSDKLFLFTSRGNEGSGFRIPTLREYF